MLGSELGLRYIGDMDRLFDTYAELVPVMADFYRERFPKDEADTDFVYRQAIRAKAFDAVRGVLPAASLSNVGHLRHRPGLRGPAPADALAPAARVPRLRRPHAHRAPQGDPELPEAGRPRRSRAWRGAPTSPPRARPWRRSPRGLFPDGAGAADPGPDVQLLDWDPDGEVKLVAAMLYSHTHVSEAVLEQRVRAMTTDERLAVIRAYVGERANRRHKPGRAFERLTYRFDVLADYGAFRDLQRHRMLTIEWQTLSPRHGYTRPEAVDLAGAAERFDEAMERSASLHDAVAERFPAQAALRRVARLQGALLPPPQRPGGHAPPRAAHHPAGPPRLPGGGPGDAPPHRRAGRPPGRRRGDALRRPLARSRASSASRPSAGPRQRRQTAVRSACCWLWRMGKLGVEGLLGRR